MPTSGKEIGSWEFAAWSPGTKCSEPIGEHNRGLELESSGAEPF